MKNVFLALIAIFAFALSVSGFTTNSKDAETKVSFSSINPQIEGTKLGLIDWQTLMYTKDDIDCLMGRRKKVAMFIVPVNNEAIWTTFKGFKLKASTNNFSRLETEFVKVQYYASSEIANTGLSMGEESIDKMKLFVCTTKTPDDWRAYHRILNTSTDWSEPLTAVVAIVDTSCLIRHPEDGGEWLDERNEELIWCYLRIRENDPPFEYENGTENPIWRPIAPVRWFSKVPEWAGGLD